MHSVFKSIHHPGETQKGLVYARKLVGPIGACTLPVMIGAAAAALSGASVWGYLVWGLPAALGVASLWTQFALSTTPAEIHVRPGQCAARSVSDVLHDDPPDWSPLYDIRRSDGQIELSLGWKTLVCRRERWPDFVALRKAASHALDGQRTPGSPSSVCA